jgi:LDH2 family malate/lactate/ureidoglycolate dehydrogenase
MPYRFDTLVQFGRALLANAGLDGDKPAVISEMLVTADAMGHTTHGLAQLGDYLEEIEAGAMTTTGEPDIVADRSAAAVWDGRRLPGVWLTHKAVSLASERAKDHGLCAVTIRRSHHIACLATFLPLATRQGLLVMVASSDPSSAAVAPFGGRNPVFTPDPIAVGIPTSGDPVLIDMSSSITTAGMSARLRKSGGRFPGLWAIDAGGRPTDDPMALVGDKPGTLLLTGGLDHGHKGYGMALMVEALTQALSGYGRADGETGWGASVFVQVFDPELFGGRDAFLRQTDWIAEACRAAEPIDPARPVRLPGAAAVAGLRAARRDGLTLHPGIMDGLLPWAAKLGVAAPTEGA